MIVRVQNLDGSVDEYDAQEVEVQFFDHVELSTDYRESLIIRESPGARALREASSQDTRGE